MTCIMIRCHQLVRLDANRNKVKHFVVNDSGVLMSASASGTPGAIQLASSSAELRALLRLRLEQLLGSVSLT